MLHKGSDSLPAFYLLVPGLWLAQGRDSALFGARAEGCFRLSCAAPETQGRSRWGATPEHIPCAGLLMSVRPPCQAFNLHAFSGSHNSPVK